MFSCRLEMPLANPTAKLSVLLPHANMNAYHICDDDGMMICNDAND